MLTVQQQNLSALHFCILTNILPTSILQPLFLKEGRVMGASAASVNQAFTLTPNCSPHPSYQSAWSPSPSTIPALLSALMLMCCNGCKSKTNNYHFPRPVLLWQRDPYNVFSLYSVCNRLTLGNHLPVYASITPCMEYSCLLWFCELVSVSYGGFLLPVVIEYN